MQSLCLKVLGGQKDKGHKQKSHRKETQTTNYHGKKKSLTLLAIREIKEIILHVSDWQK